MHGPVPECGSRVKLRLLDGESATFYKFLQCGRAVENPMPWKVISAPVAVSKQPRVCCFDVWSLDEKDAAWLQNFESFFGKGFRIGDMLYNVGGDDEIEILLRNLCFLKAP